MASIKQSLDENSIIRVHYIASPLDGARLECIFKHCKCVFL